MSASANKLAKLKGHAATYASLIMEELDPDDRGYIEVLAARPLLTKEAMTANELLALKVYVYAWIGCRFGSWRRCCVGW